MVSVFTQILYSAHYNDPYIFSPYESKNQFKVQSVREHLSNNIRFNEITFDPWDELYHSQQSSPDPLLEDLKSISKTIAKSIGKASKEVACAPLTLAESIAKTIEYIDDLFEAKTVIKPAAFHQTTTAHADYTKSLAPTAAFSQKKETSYDQVHFTLYQTELSSYLNEIDEHSFPAMHERTQKRIDTFNEYEHNQTSYRESYSLSQEITPYMQRHSLNIEAYEICNGNVIQHRLHQEIIEILTTSCEIERIFAGHQQTPLFGDLVADGADLAREMNKQGNVMDGFKIADYCGWLNEAEYPRLAKLIKQAAGIVVGAAEGGANIVKNTYQMFRHPWDTTKGVFFVGGELGKFLMHALGELEHVASIFHLMAHLKTFFSYPLIESI